MNLRRLSVLLATAAVVLVGCGSTSGGSDAGASAAWTYAPGNGQVVQADKTPTRIIAHAGEAAALMSFGIKPVGIYADESGQDRPQPRGTRPHRDRDPRRGVGQDRRREGRDPRPGPDRRRLVAGREGAQRPGGGRRRSQQEARRARAGRRRLAGALDRRAGRGVRGARREPRRGCRRPGDSAATRRRFEEARDAFTAAVEAKPGLTALAVSPADDQLYVANPEYAPELLDFQELGPRGDQPGQAGPGLPVLGEPQLGERRQVPARPDPVGRPRTLRGPLASR